MERGMRYAQRLLLRAIAVLGVAVVVLGCHHTIQDTATVSKKEKWQQCWYNAHIDNCADIPKGAIPAPPGTFATEWYARQAGKAEADDFVFYYNEWLDDQLFLGLMVANTWTASSRGCRMFLSRSSFSRSRTNRP